MNEQIFLTIGSRIHQARQLQNLSQEKLADLCGLDRSHIGFIEQGRRKPTIPTLLKICNALNLSLEELFKGL